MAAVIVARNGAGSTVPTLVLEHSTGRESRNIVHDLLDGGIAVALFDPRPRSGTLELFYALESEAWAATELLSQKTAYTFSDDDHIAMAMIFTVTGTVVPAQDKQTLKRWTVTVPYQGINQ